MLTENKRRKIIREFINENFADGHNFELWKEYKTIQNGEAHAFECIPKLNLIGIGRGIYVLEETFDEAKKTFCTEYPDRDFGMCEIEDYKGYCLIYD